MKKRWYNYRPILLIFIFLVLGSLFAFYVNKHTVISIISLSVIFILVLSIAILKKKIKYLIIPCLAFIIAFGAYSITTYNFNKSVEYSPNVITARIYSVSSVKQGCMVVKADSCEFDSEKIKTNLNILIYDNSSLFAGIEIGSVIKFTPTNVYKTNLNYNDIPNSKVVHENLKYTATVNIENLEVEKFDLTFAERIKNKIKESFDGKLNNENAELAYSTLFGDKDFLSENQQSAYRLSGIAHLLAVSGLHVSIIVGVIIAVLSIFRVKNEWVKIILISAFLLMYAYICNFSISVVRASIMSLISLFAVKFGREYDSLTALGFAGVVVFCLYPLCVFDIGFLMSFGCAIGIILFNKPIKLVLIKMKIPNKLADSISLTISTLLALLIINAVFFKNLNVISLIANVIIIPVFAFAFSVVFIVSFVSLLMPFTNVLLVPLNYVFDLINVVATVLGNLSFANIPTATLNFISIFIYFVLIFSISRICLATRWNKAIISLLLLAIFVVLLV